MEVSFSLQHLEICFGDRQGVFELEIIAAETVPMPADKFRPAEAAADIE